MITACPPQAPAQMAYVRVVSTIGAPVGVAAGGRSCDGFSGPFNPQRYVRTSPRGPMRIDVALPADPAAGPSIAQWHWRLAPRGGRVFGPMDIRAIRAAPCPGCAPTWFLQLRAAGGNWVSGPASRVGRPGAYAAPAGSVVVGTFGGRRVRATPVRRMQPGSGAPMFSIVLTPHR